MVCLNYFSAYWAASSLGEWSIALACGGCLVVAEIPTRASRPQALASVLKRRKVTVFGAVPSLLEALEHENVF
ncbi:unnamed protein product, partial [Amoebophrya sp. A25]|eukprot:GSA25T00012749001.1